MLLSINMVLCGICKKAARFLENKGLINSIDPHGWFQWSFAYWIGRISLEMKDKLIDGENGNQV